MTVGVVGAGIAGLRTAQLLERAGADVTVFEALPRVGGRMWSMKCVDGWLEAGAEWIDAEHARVFGLLREIGLEPVPSDPRPRRYYFGGEWIEKPDIKYEESDGPSLADLLDASAQSAREREYLEAVALSDEGIDSDRVDLAEWRRFSTNYEGRAGDEMSAYRFPCRAWDVARAMASTLKREVRVNAELKSLRNTSLQFADENSEEFDEVVLAVPPSCLMQIDYDGLRPWEGVEMTPTCKVFLHFEFPFWEEDDWSGEMMSDLSVQQVWPRGRTLVCYINGREAEEIAAEPDPVAVAVASLSRALPEAERRFIVGRLVDWRSERFARGGFPYVPVGSRRQTPPSHGPVRYAGDWTANWMGFVEGALESAERVVEEIKNERGLS